MRLLIVIVVAGLVCAGATGCGGTSPTSATLVSTGNTTLPSAWVGPLPLRSAGTHPVCQADLPTSAACINSTSGRPQAVCADGFFSCSTDAGTCSSNGGVYCWRQ